MTNPAHSTQPSALKRHPTGRVHPTSPDRYTTVVSDAVPGDGTFHEFAVWAETQPWFHELDMKDRKGMGFMGGSLLGVSTSLAHIVDNVGCVVGEAMSERDGTPLARHHDKMNPKGSPHAAKVVWDSPHAASVA